MSRFHTIVVAAATAAGSLAVGGLAIAAEPANPVQAGSKQVLDRLCSTKDGLVIQSPYALSRCQDVRNNKSLEIEQLVCEEIVMGEFIAVPGSAGRHYTNWSCIVPLA